MNRHPMQGPAPELVQAWPPRPPRPSGRARPDRSAGAVAAALLLALVAGCGGSSSVDPGADGSLSGEAQRVPESALASSEAWSSYVGLQAAEVGGAAEALDVNGFDRAPRSESGRAQAVN